MRFEPGEVFMSKKVRELINQTPEFIIDINRITSLYIAGVFPGMNEQIVKKNNEAIESGAGRIIGIYNTVQGDIYIVTEQKEGRTMIMMPEEYQKQIVIDIF